MGVFGLGVSSHGDGQPVGRYEGILQNTPKIDRIPSKINLNTFIV